jgi:hypothetical protein
MPDLKVSTRTELALTELDHEADLLLVTDTSAAASRGMKASELMRASLPYLSTAWDFATNALNPAITFTRASAGYRYNGAGLLVSETTDVPRFSYDPIALTPRGLLIEDTSSGVATYSEDLTNAAWSKVRGSITANAIAAPDGTMTADKLVEDGTASLSHYVSQSCSFVSGTTYATSVFAKADTRSWVLIQLPSGAFGSNLRTWFDVGTGAVGTVGAGCTARIQNVGGGWYRCVVFCVATATASAAPLYALSTGDGITNYNGDSVSGLYFWGMNIRGDDSLTSYVQVVASPVVRAVDTALATNPRALTDGCWIIKGRTPSKITSGAVNMAACFDDGTSSNRRCLQYRTTNDLTFIATLGGTTQCLISLGTVAPDTDFAVAVRWADNNFAASLNGGAVVADGAGLNPSGLTTARVGRGTSGNYWNSTIRYIETRRTATDAELVLLST